MVGSKRTNTTMEIIDIGETVVCDVCNDDYTDLPDSGGFIFGSYAYCPKCAIDGMKNIQKYKEESRIRAVCPSHSSFADFVRGYRGGNNLITITNL